jgi:hypothetical protein
MRAVNEFPQREFDKAVLDRDIRNLIKTDKNKICISGNYHMNNIGLYTLYLWYPNICEVTKGNLMSMLEGFHNDAKLKTAIKKALSYSPSNNHFLKWLGRVGIGSCSNYRPTSAKALYEMHSPENAKVFDFASGYGGRLLGAYASENVKEYVGIDVNTITVGNANKLINYLLKDSDIAKTEFSNKSLSVLQCASEEFLEKYPNYKGYFDLSFSSPQYFNTEVYGSELSQSCLRYPIYKDWLMGFYRPTIHNAIDALKDGGTFMINIFDKVSNIKQYTKVFASEKGFFLSKKESLFLNVMPGSAKGGVARDIAIGSNSEPIWKFQHYNTLYNNKIITKDKYEKCEKEQEKSIEDMKLILRGDRKNGRP